MNHQPNHPPDHVLPIHSPFSTCSAQVPSSCRDKQHIPKWFHDPKISPLNPSQRHQLPPPLQVETPRMVRDSPRNSWRFNVEKRYHVLPWVATRAPRAYHLLNTWDPMGCQCYQEGLLLGVSICWAMSTDADQSWEGWSGNVTFEKDAIPHRDFSGDEDFARSSGWYTSACLCDVNPIVRGQSHTVVIV